jgi:hypothetical protein
MAAGGVLSQPDERLLLDSIQREWLSRFSADRRGTSTKGRMDPNTFNRPMTINHGKETS